MNTSKDRSEVPQALQELIERAESLAPMLKALADENRLLLLLLLADGPHTVRELQDLTGLNQTLVSHHLGALRGQGFVYAVPKGRANLYSLCCGELAEPFVYLASLAASSSKSDEVKNDA